jgi:glycerol uptake facilitator protein
VITTAWALAVFVGAYSVAAISGAHLNPAVTIGLVVAGKFEAAMAPMYIGAQFIGAFIGAVLVFLHYYPHWAETSDPGLKLAVFSTGPAVRNVVWNLVSEIIGTFVLVFGILAIDGPVMNNGSFGALGIIPVAFLVWVIGLSLGGTTGYAINPARDLGPRIAHAVLPIPGKGSSDWGYAWIPVVGPNHWRRCRGGVVCRSGGFLREPPGRNAEGSGVAGQDCIAFHNTRTAHGSTKESRSHEEVDQQTRGCGCRGVEGH